MTNIALGFAVFATQLSPRAVYFIQTGSSALSNTYIYVSAGTNVNFLHSNVL